ncbi:MAG: hypothetical protein RL336_7 [Pseudomonadota bacterium]|jgi:uncharacterized membrane protein YfcA
MRPQYFVFILPLFAWILFVHQMMGGDWQWLQQYLPFTGLGLMGAIFANSTGAGGGVVFIPAFNWLGFSDAQSVGTSFAIQCFGMTAGSFAWLRFAKSDQHTQQQWQCFPTVTLLCGMFSVLGLVAVNTLGIQSPADLKSFFAVFSLLLGGALLFSVIRLDGNQTRAQLELSDKGIIVLIGALGGMVTGWLSVGVGEILALYLLLRGYSATMSVAAAVCVSAISVWSGIAFHTMQHHVVWDVIIFAGPAAVVGGTLAKRLAVWLPARQLKLFFSCWVLLMGVVSLPWQAWF